MTARRRLAAVPGETTTPAPSRRKPRTKSVAQAAADGDRRGELIGMRLRIAADIDNPNTPARDIAALSRRLLEIGKEIEAMDARDEDRAEGAGAVDESFDASSL